MMKRTWLLFSVSLFLILSCKNNSRQGDRSAKYNLQLNLHDTARYYYTITNSTTTSATRNDKEIETTNRSEIGMLYEMTKDSTGNYLLKLTYDKLLITLQNQGGIQIIDAAKGADSPDPVEKVLSNIRGSSLLITMQPNGKILQVAGSKEIADKILASISTQEALVRQAIEKQISRLVGDQFVQNSVAITAQLLPDSALYIGDSWSRTTEQISDITFRADTEYTLAAVADSIAEIEMKSGIEDIVMGANSGLGAAGYMVTTDLKGKQTGTMKMDVASGMIVAGVTNTTIEGTIQVAGNEVPLTIRMKKEVAAKKI